MIRFNQLEGNDVFVENNSGTRRSEKFNRFSQALRKVPFLLEALMPVGIYPRTKYHRRINSEGHKGQGKGRIVSVEFREKMRLIGLNHKHSVETKKKLSIIRTGKKTSKETKIKLSVALRGANSSFWKGGLMQDKDYQLKMTNIYSANRRAKKRNAEGKFTLGEWEKVKEDFNYICPSCKKKEPEITLTKDHIVPLSKKGTNFILNIQPLCMQCNRKKQSRIINFKEKNYGKDY